MSGELIRASEIMRHVQNGRVDTDLAVEDVAEERARWEAGNPAERRVAAAYAAVEEGRQLVDIHSVVARGGVHHYLPKLALAPSTAKDVRCRMWRDGRTVFRTGPRLRRWSLEVDLPRPGMDEHWHQGRAMVPPIPPDVRAVANDEDLVLWEAVWTQRKNRPVVHIDPALLEHVVGTLYVVKAAWDVSALEAAALR